jgi:hypothetical protein
MSTIAKTFPEIADLWMEVTETGSMDFERDTRIIRKDRHNGYIGCSNPACQGGVNVLPIIDDIHGSTSPKLKEGQLLGDVRLKPFVFQMAM